MKEETFEEIVARMQKAAKDNNKEHFDSISERITYEECSTNRLSIKQIKHNSTNIKHLLPYSEFFTYSMCTGGVFDGFEMLFPENHEYDILLTPEICLGDLRKKPFKYFEDKNGELFLLNIKDPAFDDSPGIHYLPPTYFKCLEENEKRTSKEILSQVEYFINESIQEAIAFLEYQMEKYFQAGGQKITFLYFLLELIPELSGVPAKRKSTLINWVEGKLSSLKDNIIQHNPLNVEELNNKRDKRFSHSQQMMLLERLGIIKFLDQLKITQEKKAILISIFIGKDTQNTRMYLGTMNDPKHKNTCNNKDNNELISQLFKELGITNLM